MYDGDEMNTATRPEKVPAPGESVPAGRHDPEGRRRQIVRAAAELIIEVGLAKLTHRLAAQRAGVSLGSTTRYFANLDELRKAALTELSELLEQDLATTRALLESEGCTPESLTKDISAFLADRELVRISLELTVAANADPTLRPLANHWAEGIVALLTPDLGPAVARGIVLVMDGASVHASTNEQPLPDEMLRAIFSTMLAGKAAHTETNGAQAP